MLMGACCPAACIVIFLPSLFTTSPEVMGTMRTFLPFMCTALVIHTASMATEGMLLAGAQHTLLPCQCLSCCDGVPTGDMLYAHGETAILPHKEVQIVTATLIGLGCVDQEEHNQGHASVSDPTPSRPG